MRVRISNETDGINSLLKLENYRMCLCMILAAVEVSKRKIRQQDIHDIIHIYADRSNSFAADYLCGAGDTKLLTECRSVRIPVFDEAAEQRLKRLEMVRWQDEVNKVREGQNYAAAVSTEDRVRYTDYRVVLVMSLAFHDVLGFGGIKRLPEVYRIATEIRTEDVRQQPYGEWPEWLFNKCAGERIEAVSEDFERQYRRLLKEIRDTGILRQMRTREKRAATVAQIANMTAVSGQLEDIAAKIRASSGLNGFSNRQTL